MQGLKLLICLPTHQTIEEEEDIVFWLLVKTIYTNLRSFLYPIMHICYYFLYLTDCRVALFIDNKK